jgi:uncharacterized protein YbbC (DUF1343 family)
VRVHPGLEVLLKRELFKNRRIGLITNHTGINYDLESNFHIMLRADYKITKLFSPEHGIYGDHPDGQYVESSSDTVTGIPIYSLYGATQKPTKKMLKDVDVLLFDIQDIGARYYTYMSTMILSMEAASKYGVEFAVLDRPNPIGGTVLEGNMPDVSWISPVCYAPVTIRHAMTAGEISLFAASEKNLNTPSIVRMEGWSRSMCFDETGFPWVPTSPSAPSLDMALLYPGTCLLEGTNVSEGRGTSTPFQVLGAPWIDGMELSKSVNALKLPGIKTRPVYFRPCFSKWAGNICQGIQIHVFEPKKIRPVEMGVHLLFALRDHYPEHFEITPPGPNGKHFLDLLCGGPSLSNAIKNDHSPDDLLNAWSKQAQLFARKREEFLIYD